MKWRMTTARTRRIAMVLVALTSRFSLDRCIGSACGLRRR
jgi:hypothetical protein